MLEFCVGGWCNRAAEKIRHEGRCEFALDFPICIAYYTHLFADEILEIHV